jgi:hypothetical protein
MFGSLARSMWAVLTSPEKGPSARLRREAQIELRSSTRLGSPRNSAPRPPQTLTRAPLSFSFFLLTFSSLCSRRRPTPFSGRTGPGPSPEKQPPSLQRSPASPVRPPRVSCPAAVPPLGSGARSPASRSTTAPGPRGAGDRAPSRRPRTQPATAHQASLSRPPRLRGAGDRALEQATAHPSHHGRDNGAALPPRETMPPHCWPALQLSPAPAGTVELSSAPAVLAAALLAAAPSSHQGPAGLDCFLFILSRTRLLLNFLLRTGLLFIFCLGTQSLFSALFQYLCVNISIPN